MTGVDSFLSGEKHNVDIQAIEKELRKLWQQAEKGQGDKSPADKAESAGQKPGSVQRACAFNLVLLTLEENAEQDCSDVIDQILVHHPGRAIIGLHLPKSEQALDAWVSARCHVQGSTKQVCSEQITVRSQGHPIEALTSVVLPLMIPDLPTFLWWRSNEADKPLLRRMLSCSQRLLIDSSRQPFNNAFPAAIWSLVEETKGCVYLADVNWRRLNSWLRVIGNAFDGFPLPMEYIFKVTGVSINYCGTEKSPGLPNQVLLFVGWLASRLGWTAQSGTSDKSKTSFAFKTKKGESIKTDINPVKHDLPEGSIASISCKFSDGKELLVTYDISKGAPLLVAQLKGSDDHQESEPTDTDSPEAVLMGKEVEVMTADPIFNESYAMAMQLLKLLGTK